MNTVENKSSINNEKTDAYLSAPELALCLSSLFLKYSLHPVFKKDFYVHPTNIGSICEY